MEGEQIPRVRRALKDAGHDHEVLVENMMDLILQERQHMTHSRKKRRGKLLIIIYVVK